MIISLRTFFNVLSILLGLLFVSSVGNAQEKHDGTIPVEIISLNNFTRKELINWAKKINPVLDFVKEKDVNGQPSYVAIDSNKTIVRLVGEENNIQWAKWTYTFTPNVELNKKLVANVVYFAYIFDKAQMPTWIQKEMKGISKDLFKEYIGKKTSLGVNKTVQLLYSVKQKEMTFSFAAE